MTIIDRYILRHFFFNIFLWFVSIVGIFIVFDLFTNLDSLITAGTEVNNIPLVIGKYYLFKSIPIVMMLSSVLGLLSAMITVASMKRHNELIPIQAAGISTIRIIMPLIFAVIFVALSAMVFREMLLPRFLDELVMDVTSIEKNKGVMVNAIIDNETGITIHGDRTFRNESRISSPSFVLRNPIVKQITYLKAQNAIHCPANNNHKAGFMLLDLHDIPEILKGESLSLNGQKIVITHQDEPDWLEENSCFVVTNVPFDYLASNDAWRQYASTLDMFLAARNRSLDVGNRIMATIHARLIQPFLDVMLLFLGLPVVLLNGDRNIFKTLGISGLIVISFIALREVCQHLGSSMDMPVLGAWLPLLIFGPIAVNQFVKLYEN
ncbi:MAG: LptF/LptG family permease [Planctomycetaceae bacterium]|jgi:lipopolysaccharide export system permease protein|nr:LptF/LptG family permease [Planctomycetaceae bacterium]